jgi:hypothetical protein
MSHTLSLSIRNVSVRLRIVMVEPWGREFLLTLDEKLEVTARAESAQSGFRLMESNNRTLVFVEGCSGVSVIKDGSTHNLDFEAITGTSEPELLPTHRTGHPMWDRDLDGLMNGATMWLRGESSHGNHDIRANDGSVARR